MGQDGIRIEEMKNQGPTYLSEYPSSSQRGKTIQYPLLSHPAERRVCWQGTGVGNTGTKIPGRQNGIPLGDRRHREK